MSELLLVGFCVLALLIFLLSLVTSNIDRNIHESEWESDQTNVNSTHNQQDTIAGAINTYRRIRQIEGAKSARRETITITILGFTAIFALAAAVAAGYSALIFHQQQSDFVDQEQRQLRAYVFSDKVDIYNADDDISKHSSEAPRAELLMKNTGVTPAYNVTTFVGASVLTFPLRFTMADVYKTATISMASTSIGILPHDARQQSIAIVANAEQPLTIEQKVSLNNGETAIYFYRETIYYDAFEIRRCTRFKYFVGGNVGFHGTDMDFAPEGQESDKDCRDPNDLLEKRLPLQLPPIPHYQF